MALIGTEREKEREKKKTTKCHRKKKYQEGQSYVWKVVVFCYDLYSLSRFVAQKSIYRKDYRTVDRVTAALAAAAAAVLLGMRELLQRLASSVANTHDRNFLKSHDPKAI